MKQWTREESYRVLKSKDEIEQLYKQQLTSMYRQQYHIQPITGFSSDPDGFVYHNGIWHLFYQWGPFGAVHGLKYWYHVTSKDLVSFDNQGIGLSPDHDYDNKGVHSGSAISYNNELYFFYTGNHRDENWIRTPYTCTAKLDHSGKLIKLDHPLFGPRSDYSEHQRDPKVIYVPFKQCYYMFIGAQTLDKKGCILVYSSKDLFYKWNFEGKLNVIGYEDFGGMWECPCIKRIDDKDILIFSPQYIKLPGRGNSTNHNIYLIGSMDFDTLTFIPEGKYHFLDYGFDFYAAQFAANINDFHKAIMIAWIGLPDNHYPSEEQDYAGSMTLVREITLRNVKLYKRPVKAINQLRNGVYEGKRLPDACELVIHVSEPFHLHLFTDIQGNGGLKLSYQNHTLTIDKSDMLYHFNKDLGEILDIGNIDLSVLDIFIDRCSIEIFMNDGEKTFTAHIYPKEEEHYYTMDHYDEMVIYKLMNCNKDEFIV